MCLELIFLSETPNQGKCRKEVWHKLSRSGPSVLINHVPSQNWHTRLASTVSLPHLDLAFQTLF